ncbi:MAG: SprB repeat-containing protein, partial [Bacteroidota bacterium]
MKRHILLLSVLVWTILSATAQGTIQLTVTSATATSTCSDWSSTSNHPSLRLKVNNGDWALYRYPQNPDCEIPLPALQFEESYDCPVDIGRTSFNVCLEVFENDARLNAGSCKITPDNGCTVQLCQDFQLPLPGNTTTYGLSISDSEPSSGSVQFTISMDDNFIGGINDLPCSAIDLGVLEQNTTLGDSSTDAYTNYCATNENEIQSIRTPDGQEIFNSYGVWHKFKTATTDLSKVIITAKSSTIDPIHLQVVLFEATANCFENPKPLAIAATRATYDERLEVSCDVIQPDTEYLILIDGFNDVLEEYFGYYSLEITGVGTSEASDATCTATALGTVPENGAITPTATYSNFCADGQGDPRPTTFSVQQGVLFTFNAPSSGIVQIDVTSDPNSADPIDAEVAIFGARSCAAIASMTEQASTAHAGATTSLTARCLVAGEKYYVLVDGTEQNPEGLFNLQLTDLGAQPIITTIDTTLCSGETVAVGNSNYNSTGQYQTVIPLPSGCDSIVVLNLVVQSPLSLDGDLIENASDENASDGVANVNATGGSGSYSYLWSGGQTTATADNLTAGVDYCVTVTDAIGCTATTCVFIDFVNSIQPDVTTSPLRCNGSDNGQIVISASRGQAP